ncbi:MAG: hypothetical protein HKP61_03580 [Dactylosporangium sp.]|nr:hypothetical protein [Dactylosporangium sp.]
MCSADNHEGSQCCEHCGEAVAAGTGSDPDGPAAFSVPPELPIPPYEQPPYEQPPYPGPPPVPAPTSGPPPPASGPGPGAWPGGAPGYPAAGPGWPPALPRPPLGQPATPPMAPMPPVSPVATIAVDVVLCGTFLLAVLVLASVIGMVRGGGISAVLHGLGWVHLLLATMVTGVYWAGSWLLAGRTPGAMISARIAGRFPVSQRSEGVALLPVVIAVALAGLIAGLLAPVGGSADDDIWTRSGERPNAQPDGAGGTPSRTRDAEPRPTPSPSVESADPVEQASEVEVVLTSSSSSRERLRVALNIVDQCGDVDFALLELQSVGAERAIQLDQARALVVTALPNGEAIRSSLAEALTYSLQADEAFVTWAINVLDVGCGHDPDYDAGVAASGSAQSAKKRFVALWNPVASAYGLRTRTEADI